VGEVVTLPMLYPMARGGTVKRMNLWFNLLELPLPARGEGFLFLLLPAGGERFFFPLLPARGEKVPKADEGPLFARSKSNSLRSLPLTCPPGILSPQAGRGVRHQNLP